MSEGAGNGWKWAGNDISSLLVGWKEMGNPKGSHTSSPSWRVTYHPHGTSKIKPCRTFEEKVRSCLTLAELEGFANRRRVLGLDLPKWTEDERRVILAWKYELEKKGGSK